MVMLSFSYAFATPAFFREGISLPSGAGTGTGMELEVAPPGMDLKY